jgi:streptomycin 6-kinase
VPDLPAPVRRNAELAGADQWLAELPALIADLEREWAVTVGRTFGDATQAYVAEATTAAGEPAVLKVAIPGDRGVSAVAEITTLRLVDGDGCARLLRSDVARGALLIERLGPSMLELDLPMQRRHPILCDLAAREWRPAPDCGLPTGADQARWLTGYITTTWESLGRPCSEAVVAHALECADRRLAAHDDERAVLLHGDVQQWNALQSGDGFALVDPTGLLAEPELDLGVIMREDPVELLRDGPHARAHWLAARTGCDPTAIWEWGVVQRVSVGLHLVSIGVQPIGDQMVHAAEEIAARYKNFD